MQEQKSPLPFWAKFYYHMTTVMFLMAVLGIVARFVPSPYIAENLFWLTFALGAAFWASYRLMDQYYPHPRWSDPSRFNNLGLIKKVPLYVGAMFLFYIIVQTAVFSGLPFIASFVFGSNGVQIVTVDSTLKYSARCRSGITIEDYPEMLSYVCGLPETLFQKINEGDQIRLIGIKTIMGIRVQSVALVDAP